MIRGSLVKQKACCEKVSCICARNPARKQLRYFLSYSEKGETKMIYIAKNRVPELRKALRDWRDFKEKSKVLASANLKELLGTKEKDGK